MDRFIDFMGDRRPEVMPPRRVYARADAPEPEAPTFSDRWWLFFECIDADAFDQYRRRPPDPFSVANNVPVSVIQMEFPPGTQPPPGITPEEGAWHEFHLSDTGGAFPVQQYLNLFAPALNRFLSSATYLESQRIARLEDSTDLTSIPDAGESEIGGLLARVRLPRAAAVYDVGQGNMNALIAEDTSVDLYFDLGGGVLGHTHTFPSGFNSICHSSDPVIVLSHLDWDHWSFSRRDTRTLQRKWIVPRQPVGHVHMQFLSDLHGNRTLHFWPTGVPAISSGPVQIEKCRGAATSRNHSGLALVVSKIEGVLSERMLFTGDCRYTAIPSGRDPNFTSVVVPHHGGNVGSSFAAESLNLAHSRLVYSYGRGNTFGHPLPATIAAHAVKWNQSLQTEHRRSLPGGKTLGHIHLYWRQSDPSIAPGCGNHCDLFSVQR